MTTPAQLNPRKCPKCGGDFALTAVGNDNRTGLSNEVWECLKCHKYEIVGVSVAELVDEPAMNWELKCPICEGQLRSPDEEVCDQCKVDYPGACGL
jgi:rRNA maturation endonuclease Nob1